MLVNTGFIQYIGSRFAAAYTGASIGSNVIGKIGVKKLGSGLSKTHKIEIPSNHRNNATRSCNNAFCSTLTLT